ncbi:interferon gamma receptor 1 [Takifugu flavidus]|uniref:Fibronectin type-III domain-containing protein n=1 Tax=Takifugu flavidus TaxID=433684 RepID=A0A5C6MW94_9TELE|nr:interferon gamma receptor 1 [Takifugu flavidus]TWW59059.1 hypothetical protein D4764_06G0005890 [Takifugu flavidus]
MNRNTLTALLGLMMIIRKVSAEVPPPTDVEVSCKNLQVTVGWNYRAQPQTIFNVTIMGANWYHVASTEEHQFDLTNIIWSSEERCMSSNYVSVTATVGGKHSKPALSNTFTFNNVKTAALTCQLDFPPVKLVRKGQEVSLSFRNPFHFYTELKAAKINSPTFSVTVNSHTGQEDFSCSVKEETCKNDFVIPLDANNCVTLDGILFDRIRVGQVLFKKTESICPITAADTPWLLIGSLLGLTALAVIAAVAIIVVKCYSAKEPVDEPTALQWNSIRNKNYTIVSPVDTCMVYTEPRNEKEPSLSSSEDLHGTVADGGREDESSSRELAGVGGLSERSGSDEDLADFSTDFSESEGSAYDSPHFPVDMGHGDLAIGYTERHRFDVNVHIK